MCQNADLWNNTGQSIVTGCFNHFITPYTVDLSKILLAQTPRRQNKELIKTGTLLQEFIGECNHAVEYKQLILSFVGQVYSQITSASVPQ